MHPTHLLGVVAGLVGLAAAAPTNDGQKAFFYKGHDLSSLKMLEDGDSKAVFVDTARNNATRRADEILADGGMNGVRLRLWVNPIPGQYDLSYVLALASRFHRAGQAIYLNYHFSDTWADPQHNNAPVAWPTTVEPLAGTLRAYVNETLHAFDAAGIPLALVSLGNEIRHGMLWPQGQADVDIEPAAARVANFTGLATLYAAARRGFDDFVSTSSSIQHHGHQRRPAVMLHMDNGWNTTLQELWFGALTATRLVSPADWDVLGFSFYPFYGTNATFENLASTLDWAARRFPGTPLHVVETDWPARCDGEDAPALSEPGVPVGAAGQTAWVRRIEAIVKDVVGGVGQGIWYWEPAWLNNTSLGSACQDAVLFDQDWSQYPRVTGYSRSSVDMYLDSV
ncbi:family 53 glycosyl hydrolase [Phyllosticta citriasiana]|uniref:Arabinogalactan endo-beta-1,4-galactanase n=1 Tax=Phyllosticta citriasiana TaxID=595635 RepID=A0ABR1KSL2_9PEZI